LLVSFAAESFQELWPFSLLGVRKVPTICLINSTFVFQGFPCLSFSHEALASDVLFGGGPMTPGSNGFKGMVKGS